VKTSNPCGGLPFTSLCFMLISCQVFGDIVGDPSPYQDL
jgi:hypothetical protein